MLKDLLSAEPLIEYSDEHRRNVLQRLSKLMHETFGNPPVGFNDGSGGRDLVKRTTRSVRREGGERRSGYRRK